MNQIKNQKILIDSCILIYCGTDKYNGKGFKELLRLLVDQKNRLAISEICSFEVIKNCQKKENFPYFIKLIDYVHNIGINRYILMNSAILHSLYVENKNDKEKEKFVGDLIIGGTAVYYDALLLTTNLNDFPEPYWEIITKDYVTYEDGRKTHALNRYLLKFDHKKAKECGEELFVNKSEELFLIDKSAGHLKLTSK